jgi:glycosyltransferase involved in cell wall biosynthesis
MSAADSPRVVAYYCPGWPPGSVPNGIVTYVGTLVDALADGDREALVISLSCTGTPATRPHVTIEDQPVSGAVRFATSLAMRLPVNKSGIWLGMRLASAYGVLRERYNCDLLEMEESFGAARIVRRLVNVPVVVRLHGPWFLNGPANNILWDSVQSRKDGAERMAIRDADGVTSPSLAVLESVRQHHRLPLDHAAVIPNPAPIVPMSACWTPEKREGNTVLFVGRFDKHKGGDLVIDAFSRILRYVPDTSLIFVGPDLGIKDDSGAVCDLKEYIAKRVPPKYLSQIEVKGMLSAAEISPLRRSAAVTMMASRFENFSLALVEALAYGCPTVATAVGGNPEIVLDGKTGLLCKAGDAESLAQGVVELLNAPARAAEMGRAAAIDMRDRLSPRRVADLTWAYYEEVWARAARHRRRRPLNFMLPLLYRSHADP